MALPIRCARPRWFVLAAIVSVPAAIASPPLSLRHADLVPAPPTQSAGGYTLRGHLEQRTGDGYAVTVAGGLRIEGALVVAGGDMCLSDLIFANGFQP